MKNYSLSHLEQLEAESIFIFREVVACFENPVLLYSLGKDSSVMLKLAQKAFYPKKVPFPLLHVDTSFKFREMYAFREKILKNPDINLLVYKNKVSIEEGMNPVDFGTQTCCSLLKTRALIDAIKEGSYDAVIGGARREEERSRAKEKIFSFRNNKGIWDPKKQRPELWNLYNTKIKKGESIRVFPLSNWTELDIWTYIERENIDIVPLYFAREREVVNKNGQLIIAEGNSLPDKSGKKEKVFCRFRTLGCYPCSGAISSRAQTVPEIIDEIKAVKFSERSTRIIDFDTKGSMELKKREGYF